jgi:hypothetical protein
LLFNAKTEGTDEKHIPLVLLSWFFVLLIRNIANTVDVTAINAAVRKVRSYDSGDGGGYERLKKE